jgi:glycosyltransferase involved in cell wall biosynthesis
MTRPLVTAIIPSLVAPERAPLLTRAIASLLGQSGVAVLPLVVVNGDRFDAAQLDELRRRSDIRLHIIAEAGVAAARRVGRELVETEFFCFLDDDDEYLPGALAARLAPLRADESLDATVGNGYRTYGGRMTPHLEDPAGVAAAPLRSLATVNWLASCAGLFRTSRIGPEYFAEPLAHYEWTYLAFQLVLTRRIAFVPDMTFVVHETPGSASRTAEHELAAADILGRILKLDLDRATRRLMQRKYGAAMHVCADHHRAAGRLAEAWACHAASLRAPGGLRRYGLYTRKLLWSQPRGLAAAASGG